MWLVSFSRVVDSRFLVAVVSVLHLVSLAGRLPEEQLHVDLLVGGGHLEELGEDVSGQVDDVLSGEGEGGGQRFTQNTDSTRNKKYRFSAEFIEALSITKYLRLFLHSVS